MRMVTYKHSSWNFVFGSNLAGRHGKGAAKTAQEHYGAAGGKGEGISGRSYALPTKDADLKIRRLDDIRSSAATFLKFAEQRPDMTFQVTRVGCGLAGYSDADIAPIFEDAPQNVLLPRKWYLLLEKVKPEFRVIVTGAITFSDYDYLATKLDRLLGEVDVPIRIVSGGIGDVDDLGERYTRERDYDLARFEPNRDLFGDDAPTLNYEAMAWYADALCLFWNEQDPQSRAMLEIAEREDLIIRQSIVNA